MKSKVILIASLAFFGLLNFSAADAQTNSSPSIPSAVPNLVAGSPANYAATNIFGATISGGGPNTVSQYYGTIAGGEANTVDAISGAIGGGKQNSVSGSFGTVPGGDGNSAR